MTRTLALLPLLGLLAACEAAPPAAATPPQPAFDREPAGQVAPTRLAIAPDGTIWVSDPAEGRVAGYRGGRRIATISGLARPLGIATDGRTLFVGLGGAGSVEAWDIATGTHARTVAAPGALRMPNALALAPDGTLYVADSRSDVVRSWDATGRENPPLGGPDGLLRFPAAVAVDARHVVVADQGNHRLQVFDRDGRWVRTIGGPVPSEASSRDELVGRFTRVQGVAIDGDRILALDAAQNVVHVLDRDGRPIGFLGGAGTCDRCFGLGTDLAARGGAAWVADPDHRRWVSFTQEATR